VRCLTGVYRPDTGAVSYRLGRRGAVDLTTSDARTVAWLRTHHIASFDGLLAAAPRLPAAVAAARAARCSRTSAVAALGRFHISNLAPVPIGRLRAADRLSVALAAALLAERPFVVLDEPEGFADSQSLTRWVRRLTDDGAAVVATGSPGSPLESIATATGELRRGKIVWRRP
jgi:ABC-2 type transport system ATP-binding protein